MAADGLYGIRQCVVGGFIVLALALMTGKLSREQEQRVVGSMFGLWY
ncbi:anaerobic dimethyl sulfoxide reductase subunit C [Klebsiella pneumoniae]|nr:anaerobic dimethyl sulfoxide reductase subunit C [Klebsiella pneumoniae]